MLRGDCVTRQGLRAHTAAGIHHRAGALVAGVNFGVRLMELRHLLVQPVAQRRRPLSTARMVWSGHFPTVSFRRTALSLVRTTLGGGFQGAHLCIFPRATLQLRHALVCDAPLSLSTLADGEPVPLSADKCVGSWFAVRGRLGSRG